jgi:type IX secretion system PorP/SprF family membrane protein
MKNFIVLILSIVCSGVLFSQDFHFSQSDVYPSLINPALAGMRMSNGNATLFQLNSRAQIGNYTRKTSAYTSVVANADWNYNSKFSFSSTLIENRAAAAGFNDFSAVLGGAYDIIHQAPNYRAKNNLKIGMQVALKNRQVNPQNFTYDEQYAVYEDDGFDRSLASGEQFTRTSLTKVAANFGLQYLRSARNDRWAVTTGIGFFNLTRPNESLYNYYRGLPMRIVYNLSGRFVINNELSIQPSLLYMDQSNAKELLSTILLFSKIENSESSLIYGFAYRSKDAVIFQTGIKNDRLMCKLSYDLITNYSKMYRNSSFELNFTYFLEKHATNGSTNVKVPM